MKVASVLASGAVPVLVVVAVSLFVAGCGGTQTQRGPSVPEPTTSKVKRNGVRLYDIDQIRVPLESGGTVACLVIRYDRGPAMSCDWENVRT